MKFRVPSIQIYVCQLSWIIQESSEYSTNLPLSHTGHQIRPLCISNPEISMFCMSNHAESWNFKIWHEKYWHADMTFEYKYVWPTFPLNVRWLDWSYITNVPVPQSTWKHTHTHTCLIPGNLTVDSLSRSLSIQQFTSVCSFSHALWSLSVGVLPDTVAGAFLPWKEKWWQFSISLYANSPGLSGIKSPRYSTNLLVHCMGH